MPQTPWTGRIAVQNVRSPPCVTAFAPVFPFRGADFSLSGGLLPFRGADAQVDTVQNGGMTLAQMGFYARFSG